MAFRKTALEKEIIRLEKQEAQFLQKNMEKTDSRLNKLLEEKIPDKLQDTLDRAFFKAFQVVFQKGTKLIEKTYAKKEIEENYKIQEYAVDLKDNRKNLKVFSKKASSSANANMMISGVSGVGLGALGIGIPDILLFTSMLLRSVYGIALRYGYEYDTEAEQKWILLLIKGALSHGQELDDINEEANNYIYKEAFFKEKTLNQCIKETAQCLSKELLYMKFLQGVPIVGAIGGAYDFIYMKKVNFYVELKYRRRFFHKRFIKV